MANSGGFTFTNDNHRNDCLIACSILVGHDSASGVQFATPKVNRGTCFEERHCKTMQPQITKSRLLLPLTLTILFAVSSQAALELGTPFCDHMVLQRDRPIPVWGWDDPNTAIIVTLGEHSVHGTANEFGKWSVRLPAQGPVAESLTMAVKGSSTVTIRDVLIGEVWLCGGQSNMEWPVGVADNADTEIAAAHHGMIRHIKILHTPAKIPQGQVTNSGWKVCSPQTVAKFSAVGYFFGRHVHTRLDVPVGLIGCNWGGTRIEPWTPAQGFRRVPVLSEIAEHLADYPLVNEQGEVQHQSATALYNGMIHPLVPYAMRGAIWYQGESNNGEGMLYRSKMEALIAGWRTVWNDEQMPFYFVQLAPYRYGAPDRLPGIWEAQLDALTIPQTGMVVTTDIGDVSDIHPTNKQEVGRRLALWAFSKTYRHETVSYSGPLYHSLKVEGDRIRIFFNHADGGLVSRNGKPLTWFSIAGADRSFVAAEAFIDGNTIVVESDKVPEPLSVRFGWHEEAEPNLTNKAGLPASPFRTHPW